MSSHPRSPHVCPIISLTPDQMLQANLKAQEVYREHAGKDDDQCSKEHNLSDEDIPRKYFFPRCAEQAVGSYLSLPVQPDWHQRPDVGDCVEVRYSNNTEKGELYCTARDVKAWPYVFVLPVEPPVSFQLMGWQYAGEVVERASKPYQAFYGYTWPVDELRPMEDLYPALYEKPRPV